LGRKTSHSKRKPNPPRLCKQTPRAMRPRKSVVVTSVLCRLGTANGRRWPRIEKWGGSPSGPKPQARKRRLPQPNFSSSDAKTRRMELGNRPGFCHAMLPILFKSSRQYWDGLD
jgi:hypothetical protein